jgi:hypothetical protein
MTATCRHPEAIERDAAGSRSGLVYRSFTVKAGNTPRKTEPVRSWWQDLSLMILSATILFSISLAPVAGTSLPEEPTPDRFSSALDSYKHAPLERCDAGAQAQKIATQTIREP